MLDVLIVDDEPLARARLVRMIDQLEGYHAVAEAGDSDAARRALARHDPDIVLLDIQMPGQNGLEAASNLGEGVDPPAIVFCTAFEEHALEAFDTPAVGYLLKPVKREALERALGKATELTRPARRRAGAPPATSLTAKTHRGIERIPLTEVRFFLADQKYVTVYHTGGDHLLDTTLKELEEQFADEFVRVHRNALVSVAHIRALERSPEGGYRLNVEGVDTKPAVSRRHATQVKALLQRL